MITHPRIWTLTIWSETLTNSSILSLSLYIYYFFLKFKQIDNQISIFQTYSNLFNINYLQENTHSIWNMNYLFHRSEKCHLNRLLKLAFDWPEKCSPKMFTEVHWPMKLPEMDPVLGPKIFSGEKVCAFECCLGQLKEHFTIITNVFSSAK